MRTKAPRADKVHTVGELTEVFGAAKGAILTEYRGLTVSEISKLRTKLRPDCGEYHVVKNTLFKRALGDQLTPELESLLAGPTAIAFAREDVVLTSKALLDFLRDLRRPEILVKGGYIDGKVYSPERITALSKIPPRPIVLSQALGTLQAPLTGFLGTMNGILSGLVGTLQALADKREAEGV